MMMNLAWVLNFYNIKCTSKLDPNVNETIVESLNYIPGVENDHIGLQNVDVKSNYLYMRSSIDDGSMVRWDSENNQENWSFKLKFNEPNLSSNETAGIYLRYTKEKSTIGEFKGGNGIFDGVMVGLEFLGKSVDLVFVKNDGKDYTHVEEYVSKTDSINPLRFRGVENITMKVICTEKNFKVELYDDEKLIYDNFKLYNVKEMSLYKPGNYFAVIADYKHTSSIKSFRLKEAQLYKREEKQEYNPYKSHIEKMKTSIREKEQINHYDQEIQELIHKIEISSGFVKAVIGDLPETSIQIAEKDLKNDLDVVGEKISKLQDIIKNNGKTMNLSHRINELEIKIKKFQRGIKEFDRVMDKLRNNNIKGYSAFDNFILITGCILMAIWISREFSNFRRIKQNS